MIHVYALEPQLVASWAKREQFRFFHDKFGLGTPRAMLELPAFTKWKRAVVSEAERLGLSEEDTKRLEELFRLLGEHKSRRSDSVYDGLLTWLENAEREHARRPFAGILAAANPRAHSAVLIGAQFDVQDSRWSCPVGVTTARKPEAIAQALVAMLVNCRRLHLVDPHFGPENARHRKVLEAILSILAQNSNAPEVIRLHCSGKAKAVFFESEAAQMAARFPVRMTVEFIRWKQRDGGEKLHNRYVLTDLGGVMLGTGLDEGSAGETDDLNLLSHDQYALRWKQFVEDDGSFELVDRPSPVTGTRGSRS